MTATVAVTSGALALAIVLLVASIARRPPARVPSDDGRRPPLPRPIPRALRVLPLAFLAGAGVAAMGPFTVGAIGALVAVLAVRRRRLGGVARQRAVDAAMPDAVELLVLCIHAGCSPTQAVLALAGRAPPVLQPVFAEVELRLHRGRSLADALHALDDAGSMGRDVAHAIAAADRDGLPLAPVLDRLTIDARAARRRLAEADARRLPVRLTFPMVVCALPSFVLLAIAPAVLGALSTLRANTP